MQSSKQQRKEKPEFGTQKKIKTRPEFVFLPGFGDLFVNLPDELVLSILGKLCASADSPKDLFNALITCKRFWGMGFNPCVISKAGCKTLAVKAKNWSESAHKFLKMCADTGNTEACFTLGMIRFYCLKHRGSGESLMAKAAAENHSHALYSMAGIQSNFSGWKKSNKDSRDGVALCARTCFAGDVDALCELGHCLQNGYEIRQNMCEGRRFQNEPNARELACVGIPTSDDMAPKSWIVWDPIRAGYGGPPLLSDLGCNLPALDPHPVNIFLSEWFSDPIWAGLGLRLCSHLRCGQTEARRLEFPRCWVCGTVNYCSRACESLDWDRGYRMEPVEEEE